MGKARILVVEDEALFSELLQTTLSKEDGVEVVGVTRDGETAIKMAKELKPDAIIMDIELKGSIDGIEAALKIKEHLPKTGIVILSSHRDRRYLTSLHLRRAQAGPTSSSSPYRT